MKMIGKGKKMFAALLALVLVVTAVFGNELAVKAAKSNAVRKVSLKIGSQTVTKKTYSMNVGQTVKLKVSVSPAGSKKSVTFASSKKSVATVSKNGRVTAKKKGTAKIKVTVSGRNNKKKQTWVKIKVGGKAKEYKIKITAKGKEATATLYDNATTRALVKKFPLTVSMMDLYDRELCYRFKEALPTDNARDTGYEVGEIVYYPPMHSFVILYEQNGEEFEMQKLGRVTSGLNNLSGIGDTKVTFELLK